MVTHTEREGGRRSRCCRSSAPFFAGFAAVTGQRQPQPL